MTEMPYSVEVAGEGEDVEVGALADVDVGDLGEGHLLEEDALVLVEPALQPVDLRERGRHVGAVRDEEHELARRLAAVARRPGAGSYATSPPVFVSMFAIWVLDFL